MPAAVVVGAQWGDEGKGKIVDLLAPHADLVVRFAGGANAGHTLVVKGKKLVLHLVPSGILHPNKRCLVAQGTVVDPGTFIDELDELIERKVGLEGRLMLADRAHVVLPHHKMIDGWREEASGGRIGTTKRGIGPAYEDKVGRRGIRVGDLVGERLSERVARNLKSWAPEANALGHELPDAAEVEKRLQAWGKRLAPYIVDGSGVVAEAVGAGQNILLEGAQGSMLDIDHGTYPFVTSSNAGAGGACTGSGIGPTAINSVIGIAKAYATRVGGGPFPTELEGEVGQRLREAGAEFGATTGRPRRCGWIDIPSLRMAVQINGMTSLTITKLDVLTGFETLQICTRFRLNGKEIDRPVFDAFDQLEPIYESMPGWTENIEECKSLDELPANCRAYIDRIAELAGCPITIVSVGPDREQTIGMASPF